MKHYFLLIGIVLSCVPSTAKTTITVNSQESFEKMRSSVYGARNKGNTQIDVVFKKGTYYYTEDLFPIDKGNDGAVISFYGNGSTLIPKGNDYVNGQSYSNAKFTPEVGFVSSTGRNLDIWDSMKYALSDVDVVNESTKLCRLKTGDYADASEKECVNTYIWIPFWFMAGNFKVLKIENGHIYFTVPNLSYSEGKKCYNINYDKSLNADGIGKIRYKLCNIKESKADINIWGGKLFSNYSSVHECNYDKTRLVRIANNELIGVLITDFNFICNGNRGKGLIEIENYRGRSCRITNCTFRAIRSTVIKINKSKNVTIDNNVFENCYLSCVDSKLSENVLIEENAIHNAGLWNKIIFAIHVSGKNNVVSNNKISNFGYCAIGVGYDKIPTEIDKITSIVEGNEIWYDKDYFNNYREHTLMDSGAITIGKYNDSAIVRYNNIHDYRGMGINFGIFCDDGAMNVKIYGNIVTNTPSGNSIDSRRVKGMESKIGPTNINNEITGNIVDGAIRFQGREGSKNGCVFADNIVLSDGNAPANTISNVTIKNGGVVTYKGKADSGIISLSGANYSKVAKYKDFSKLRKFIKVVK